VNLKEQTGQVLRTLTAREEKIMKMRFGLEDDSEHTLEGGWSGVRRHPRAHSPDRSQGSAQAAPAFTLHYPKSDSRKANDDRHLSPRREAQQEDLGRSPIERPDSCLDLTIGAANTEQTSMPNYVLIHGI
jgi:hypothetical protein